MLHDSAIAARLWSGARADGTGCWLWQRCRTSSGYGLINIRGRNRRAHRVAYEIVKGPIPAGLTIDHRCRGRACINPDHLEAVTNRENVMRGDTIPARNAAKTHCLNGHPFDEENTQVSAAGHRRCRTCRRLIKARHAARQRVGVEERGSDG